MRRLLTGWAFVSCFIVSICVLMSNVRMVVVSPLSRIKVSFMIDVFIVYVSFFKRRVKVCFIIGLSKYIIFSLLDLLMYCLLHWLLIEKFLSSLCKVSFGCLQSINESFDYINESFDYINASSVFINETCVYKNRTCIYSLNQVRNKFSINEKEVYI